MTAEQLAFTLPVREARGREDFFVSPANAEALAVMESWPTWPNGKLVLVGPAGSGKTHLAHVWAGMTDAAVVGARDVREDDIPGLTEHPSVVVEDADRERVSEAALFHLHNALAERNRPLLLTARKPPRDWGVSLPDLLSRMSASAVARLSAPDDDLLRAVILKQFADRQVIVSASLIDWLVARIPRSFASAKNAVEALDTVSLSTKRPVNIALARTLLDKLGDEGA